jgi:hypothetical protein
MKKSMLALLLFGTMVLVPNFIDAACRDGRGEIVSEDGHGQLYVMSKNLGDGSCAGCSSTCKIILN